MKILCFGSLNIDYVYQVNHFVKKGETLLSDALEQFSGGKGLNQAIALAKVHPETYHAGAIGENGKFLVQQLEESGVHTQYIRVLDNVSTGHAIIQNDKEGDNCILLFGGANQMITKEHVDEVFNNFSEGDYVILQNEINHLSYIIEKAHQLHMNIVLNPSPMNQQILELPIDKINYFILNEIEASQLLQFNETLSDHDLCQKLQVAYPDKHIILTLGEKGSYYINQGETIYQKAYQVDAVDTTAAGDTYTGYLFGCLAQGYSVKDAMEMAAIASSIAVTRLGAAPSIPTFEEVKTKRTVVK